jgi:hypothetical protein
MRLAGSAVRGERTAPAGVHGRQAQRAIADRGGGTFQVTATPVGGFINVHAINGVQGAGAGGDNNAGGGNGGGGGASAATDTTIYDQPEGNDVALSAGDPVTIVNCDNNNWCRISTPRKGWVWGGDLDK